MSTATADGVPSYSPGESPLGLPSLERNKRLASLFSALARHYADLEREADSSEPQSTYRWKRHSCEKVAEGSLKCNEPIISGAQGKALINVQVDFASFPFTEEEEREIDECLNHGAMAALPPSFYPSWLRDDLSLVEKAKHFHEEELRVLHRHHQHHHLPNDTSYYGKMNKSTWATAPADAAGAARTLQSNVDLAKRLREAASQQAKCPASSRGLGGRSVPSAEELSLASRAAAEASIPIEAGEQLLEIMRGSSLSVSFHPRLAMIVNQCMENTGAGGMMAVSSAAADDRAAFSSSSSIGGSTAAAAGAGEEGGKRKQPVQPSA